MNSDDWDKIISSLTIRIISRDALMLQPVSMFVRYPLNALQYHMKL